LNTGTVTAHRIWKRFRQDRARPYLTDQLRGLRRRVADREPRWRWALRGIDFEVSPGEAVAIVGANGAGKSTLLKVLTRVMYPTAGSVSISGRVGAIIELRGGMHPELSGRENTYIYGQLLGLSRRDISQRFDTIVDFADLSQAIDRQLKYYSSGMQMRLGFAIAAFLNPRVLLVDEVLAVGDAWFQQRCLDRMREVLNEGTTLILVSHDLASIEATCSRGLWLRDGALVADGAIREVLSAYRGSVEQSASEEYTEPDSTVRLRSFEVAGRDTAIPSSHHDVDLVMHFATTEVVRGRLHVGVSEGPATPIFLVSTSLILEAELTRVTCTLHDVPLPRGRYSVWVHIESARDDELMPWHPVGWFTVAGSDLDPAPVAVVRVGPVHVRSNWTREPLSGPAAGRLEDAR
jgi:ABC-type polysaccharide/polyol phosphate transport system ATPase subunit